MFIHYGELLDAEVRQADEDEYSPVDVEDEWHICPSLHEAMDIFLQYAFHGEYKTPGGLTAEETQKLYDAYADEGDEEPAGVSDGVAVRPSRRMRRCNDEACCSCPDGPVVALAAGDGERRGGPPAGVVWATRVARAARCSARARRASAMAAVE